MNIKFQNTPYFSALKNLGFSENSLENEAKSNLHFQYSNISYQQFSNEYSLVNQKDARFDRQMKAIPYALWTVVKVVCHVAQAIFIGIPKFAFGDQKSLQAHIFYIIRDFQEIFGRIFSIFHDQYGLYHIEESQFQKECYDYFLAHHHQGQVKQSNAFAAIPAKDDDSLKGVDDLFTNYKSKNDQLFNDTMFKDPMFNDPMFSFSTQKTKDFSQNATVKKAEGYYQKGDLDQALQTINSFYEDTKTKDAFLAKIAEKHFSLKQWDSAFEVIKKIWDDKKTKDTFLGKLAEKHFSLQQWDVALEVIGKVDNTKVKDAFLIKLAEKHFSLQQWDAAKEVINKVWDDQKTKEAFVAKLKKNKETDFIQRLEKHIDLQEWDDARKVISKIDDKSTKETYVVKMAERHFSLQQWDNALKAIKEIWIWDNKKTKDVFLAKLAEKHFNLDQWDKARDVIKEISEDKKTKEIFLIKLAEKHFSLQQWDDAFKVIDDVSDDKNGKIDFLVKLAEKHFSLQQWDNALKVIDKLPSGIKTKEDFIVKLVEKHLSLNQWDNAFTAIDKIDNELKDSLTTLLIEKCYQANDQGLLLKIIINIFKRTFINEWFKVHDMLKTPNFTNKLMKLHIDSKDLSEKLANQNYSEIESSLQKGEKAKSLQIIKKAVESNKQTLFT